MAEIVERTYAEAIFDIAREENALDKVFQELNFVQDTFSEYEDYLKILQSPSISKEDKKKNLTEVFGNSLSPHVLNFLKILIDKGRIGLYFGMVGEYKRILNESRNIQEVTAITAVALTPELQEKLKAKLSAISGKEIELKNQVDPEILGGILLKTRNEQIDATVKNRLEALKSELSSIIS